MMHWVSSAAVLIFFSNIDRLTYRQNTIIAVHVHSRIVETCIMHITWPQYIMAAACRDRINSLIIISHESWGIFDTALIIAHFSLSPFYFILMSQSIWFAHKFFIHFFLSQDSQSFPHKSSLAIFSLMGCGLLQSQQLPYIITHLAQRAGLLGAWMRYKSISIDVYKISKSSFMTKTTIWITKNT